MTPSPDPTFAALHEAAGRNPAMCGVLADWYEEHGHPEAAALARFGKIDHARAAWPPDGGFVWEAFRKMGRFLADSGETPDRASFVLRYKYEHGLLPRGDSCIAFAAITPIIEARLYRKPVNSPPSPTRPGT